MTELRSIASIRAGHSFQWELQTIPAVDWMDEKQVQDYDKAAKEMTTKLEEVDSSLEFLLKPLDDEYVRRAVEDAFYVCYEGNGLKSVKHIRFRPYLPQGKVQLQMEVIRYLTRVAKGKEVLKDFDTKLGACNFQAAWDVNPRVCTIVINGEEQELRLRRSLKLFYRYLDACEHEFYKQMLACKFDSIIFQYERQLEDARWRKERPKRKLPKHWDLDKMRKAYSAAMTRLTDNIYYRRGRDYLNECSKFWCELGKNQFSAPYLLGDDDVRDALKRLG